MGLIMFSDFFKLVEVPDEEVRLYAPLYGVHAGLVDPYIHLLRGEMDGSRCIINILDHVIHGRVEHVHDLGLINLIPG